MDVTGYSSSLFPKLFKLLFMDEYKLHKCDKGDLESLSGELKRMQLVLCKVAEMPREELDNQVRLWADNARELSGVMQKKVDDILVLMDEGKEFRKDVHNLLLKDKTRYQIAHTVRDIEQQVLEISGRRNRYMVDDAAPNRPGLPIIAFYTDEREIVGIELATDEVLQILGEEDSQLKILSVVGFGGSGKTTLSKSVYDKLKARFDCTAFVPVSRNPNMKDVLKQILYELDKENYLDNSGIDENKLIHEISQLLRTKRYLIVIDDLWDRVTWDTISSSLPSNDHGSRVITTTRNKTIAECCSKSRDLIYEIRPLGYQSSKRLFLRRCVASERSSHDALAEVDEILKICGGMPLAIVSIASAVSPSSARKIKEQCQEMLTSLHSARRNLDCVEELTRILSYSYFDLPNTLRACLLYLAASAKNRRVQKDNLVRKWIAEGLIPIDESCSRGEVARQYFDELINRNLIQKYVNCLGKETYEVTYMMLYVLRLLSREENFATFLTESEPHVKVMPIRLLMQCSDSENSVTTERVNLTNAWSVNRLGPANLVSFKHLKYVRVLDLDGCKDLDNSAMDDVCLLMKLEYLSLKHTQVTEIPPKISNLQNLETLDVRHTQVKVLPKEVFQLRKLTHLHFGQSGSFGVKLPVGSNQLTSLEVMGNVDSRECSESAMKEISVTQVRELEVVLYDGPTDRKQNDKLLSFVGKCRFLKSLTIYGDSNPSDKLSPESPNFPQLEKLEVAGRFLKVPRWIAQLRTLTLLVIRVSKLQEKDMVIIGGLPWLSVLSLALVALPRKKVTIARSAGFTRLEVFHFDCRVPWVSFEEKAIPNLKHLQLKLYCGLASKFPSGIMLLESLNMVSLLYSSQYAASVGVMKTVDVVRIDAASHANRIELSINGDQEIFPSNTSADTGVAETSADRVVTEAEIVEVLASK